MNSEGVPSGPFYWLPERRSNYCVYRRASYTIPHSSTVKASCSKRCPAFFSLSAASFGAALSTASDVHVVWGTVCPQNPGRVSKLKTKKFGNAAA